MNRGETDGTWIAMLIRDFIANSPSNSLENKEGGKAWDEPLVGFSSGSDPLYDEFKSLIGDIYMTPLELFSKTFPETKTSADELTVISWILPHRREIKRDNRREDKYPSERWARARIFGEKGNSALRGHLVASLEEKGYKALAHELLPFKKAGMSERYGRAATWSERHAAYAAGLGTFGLCDGLITPVGKAVRCGSVIAMIKIPPTGRPYGDHHAYCLFYAEGKCGKCIERCPAEAITAEKGHDKEKCRDYIRTVTTEHLKTRFGLEGYGCGLCQTGVPCESGIPPKLRPVP